MTWFTSWDEIKAVLNFLLRIGFFVGIVKFIFEKLKEHTIEEENKL